MPSIALLIDSLLCLPLFLWIALFVVVGCLLELRLRHLVAVLWASCATYALIGLIIKSQVVFDHFD